MSSIRMQKRPATSPMMFITSDSPGRSRRLSTMASGALSSLLASARARTTPPTSGETTVIGRPEKRAWMSADITGARVEIVGRDVEEALDLAGVEIDRKHPVGAGDGDQIGDQLGRDRRARAGLPVLPGIAEIGQDRGDPLGRGAAQRVDADQQLHQIVVGRIGGRLDDEHVLAADILVDLDENLLVGEAAHARLGDRDFEILGDRLDERQVRIARHQLHGDVLRRRRRTGDGAKARALPTPAPGCIEPRHDRRHPLRPFADRPAPCRQYPHGAAQLAVGAQAWRALHPAARRHRPGAQQRGALSRRSATISPGSASSPTRSIASRARFGPYEAALERLRAAGRAYPAYETRAGARPQAQGPARPRQAAGLRPRRAGADRRGPRAARGGRAAAALAVQARSWRRRSRGTI